MRQAAHNGATSRRSRTRRLGGLAVLAATLALPLGVSCKKKPRLPERMAGSWRATMDVGARASKDPIVRGLAKFWNREPLAIELEVSPTSLEVRRWTREQNREVVQRASYEIVDERHIRLTTEQGQLVARVDTGCADEGYCLDVTFTPEVPDSPAVVAMGFLFGCDDDTGALRCAGITKYRSFYRYAKDGGAR